MIDLSAHLIFHRFRREAKIVADLVKVFGFFDKICSWWENTEEVVDIVRNSPIEAVFESPMNAFCEQIVYAWSST